jgi:ribosomal-protein-alanine N-acetyltransferase
MFLETERLRLRPMRAGDVVDLVRLWADPEVTRYMGGPREEAALHEIFSEELGRPPPEADDLWPVEEKATGQVVGHCGLLEKEVDGKAEVELVYVFARPAWGKGYGTEMAGALKEHALVVMGLERLIALIDPGNAASEQVAIKVGMTLERETVRPGGKMMRVYVVE